MTEARQLAIYLGVDIPDTAVDGECDLDQFAVSPSYGSGPGDRDPEDAEMSAARNNAMIDFARIPARKSETGSALQLISSAIEPRYVCPGETDPDGREGVQLALEEIVCAWPHLPELRSIACGLIENHYITQGQQWQRIIVDPAAVYSALADGQSGREVRAAVESGDSRFGRIESYKD